MGKIADELNELSRNDNALIVGSEIRAAIAELEKENAELQAQLASTGEQLTSCIQLLGRVSECNISEIFVVAGEAIELIDSLPTDAKQNAEILRCAECQYDEWIRPYPEGSMKTYEDSCEKTNNAVRKRNEYA